VTRAIAAALLLVPALAWSQASAIGQLRPTLPPTNAALSDEVTAPEVNPAGLQQIGGPMLIYQHERNLHLDSIVDGLYLGTTFFDVAAFGLSLEWVRGPRVGSERDGYRRTSYAFSVGGPLLSLGTAFNVFTPLLGTAPGPNSWDLGLLTRPIRALSVGLAWKDVGNDTGTRSWELAVGTRPWGEWLTLGASWQFPTFHDLGGSRVGGVVQVEPVQGIVVGSSVSKAFRAPNDGWFWQVSLTLNTTHAGLGYALGGGPGGTDHLVSARFSAARYRGISFGARKVGLVDVPDALAGGFSALGLLGLREEDPYLRLVRHLDRATRDRQLGALVIKLDRLPRIGFAQAEELRQQLLRLRQAGKTVVAVLMNGGDKEYLIATGADRIWVAPQSLLTINGLTADVIFLGETMEKLGVRWDVARVGAFKNAPDQLTRASMSQEQRQTLEAFLDTEASQFDARISESRGMPVAWVHRALAEGLLSPRAAVRWKLVDEVVDPVMLDRAAPALVPGGIWVSEYRPPEPERRWGERRRIAIIPVIGSITGGKSRSDPLGLAHSAGSETVEKALREATDDPRVAAIVVRVDSGGGDGMASDVMYRAVLRARERKPVVASMGDAAASGGYYVAMGADRVWAEPTTLTGSIGVFVLKPGLEGLGKKLGVHVETLKRGPMADILGVFRPWTPAEQAAAQRWVDGFYEDFVSEVAKSRHLQPAQIDSVARGRIWSGADAKARGLVDALGGLPDAIAEARRRAGVPEEEDLALVTYGGAAGLLGTLGGEEGVLTQVGLRGEPPGAPAPLQRLADEVGLPSLFLLEPGLKAALPFEVRLQ
jgi:protease-4